MINVRIKRLHPDAKIPKYQTPGSAGMDLHAIEEVQIPPHDIAHVRTGIALQIPPCYEAQVRPRSGLAKIGVTVANSPGTIDSDYRGEVIVLLGNHAATPVTLLAGDRIAQIVFATVAQAELIEVDELFATSRGEGGFGSTGTR